METSSKTQNHKMSKYEIPFHIQEEIMKRLPVKPLIQFRSVSKAWRSLIDSSQFISAHSFHRHTRQQNLLLSYERPNEAGALFAICQSYIDDETFPTKRSILTLPPLPPQQITRPTTNGSSHGLVCLCGFHPSYANAIAILWNPSIRKYIVVDVPAISHGFGFGVCPVTNDPKMVSATESSREVMVYTLSSGTWRSLSTNLPAKRIRCWYWIVVTDGFFSWRVDNIVVSFDVTNESFELINLPHSLARDDHVNWRITKVRESLAMLEYTGNTCTVWMTEDGVQRSFTKLLILNTPHKIIGFMKSGVPIMNVTDVDVYDDDDDEPFKLVYDPNSEHYKVIGIGGFLCSITVDPYVETLLLFGRSDCRSY